MSARGGGVLFDRFDPAPPGDSRGLVRDLSDLLGARRFHPGAPAGLLRWGLGNTFGMTPSSSADREAIARQIADQIRQFEPRLHDVQVSPLPTTTEIAFEISASERTTDDDRLRLRIVSPRPGGTLGADVVVLGNGA